MLTAEQCLRNAFAALLKGDVAARDRWCGLAQNIMNAQERTKDGDHEKIIKGSPIKVNE